jgi:hypothetical protein
VEVELRIRVGTRSGGEQAIQAFLTRLVDKLLDDDEPVPQGLVMSVQRVTCEVEEFNDAMYELADRPVLRVVEP